VAFRGGMAAGPGRPANVICYRLVMPDDKNANPLPDALSQVTIIGTGLLGASVGLALRAAGFGGRIVGVGRSPSTLDQARQAGAIDEGTDDYAAAIPAADLVVIAVPLGGFRAAFEAIAAHDHAGLIITDVGSTKAGVHADARAALPDATRFVGSHPMAGSEQQGPAAARADLFAGKPCIVTTEPDTDADAVARVEAVWHALGMPIVRMSPAEHDAQTAAISHLPHIAAVALVQAAVKLGGWGIASTGFKDTTRLASSNPPMRADILRANRAAVLDAIDCYTDQLAALRTALDQQDDAALLKLLESSRIQRDQWLQAKEK